ncbi:hypothetical protein N7492_008377 [Penicillium capsulatum]|uniref:N-acetyltransferase domain-containing protein n=1 Tax=Penicillium capsulatum TaxID=69766 RepID=A0A9W9HSJ6_9EURO|nr:hypothetical protein N7492_008377 [Penicillium capsulatum]KAJ6105779.1 hypothetical protein N7512_009296 [Penicillium capsulatum]
MEELKKKVGQLFAVGFHGHTLSSEIKTLIRDYHIGGIVLFSRNIQTAEQLQTLVLDLQKEAHAAGHRRPLFIGIDQENGIVARITPPIASRVPGPMALGATHDPEIAYHASKATGKILDLFGINTNYAPICDINSEPLNPVIGVRSPGDNPEFVGRFASATGRGLRELNVIPSAKHFPGHGDTAVDSHYGLPEIPKTRDQLERCELIPFRRAVAEGVETVMTAHIALPNIDKELPATLSPVILDILRKDMGYDGMIVTDCLEMDGIRSTFGTEMGSVLAVKAGSDSVMICHTFKVQVASIEKVCSAVSDGTIELDRLNEATRRVGRVKDGFLNWDDAFRPRNLHGLQELNDEVATLSKDAYERSVTLVRDQPKILPLSDSSHIVFLFPGDKTPAGGAVDGEGLGRQDSYQATAYLDILKRYNSSIREIKYGKSGLSEEQWTEVRAADVVILVSINARESAYQETLGHQLPANTRALVAIAACAPYDFLEAPEVQTYITTYEPTIEAFSVAADIIFGAKIAKGTLPIQHGVSTTPEFNIERFNPERDLNDVLSAWEAALPTYPIPAENLEPLISRENAHHFVARVGPKLAGFCLVYSNAHGNPNTVHIAVVAVIPEYQGQGIGTSLLTETRSYFRTQFNIHRLNLGSSFPRFWPGVPRDLGQKVQDFFIHRGFRLSPPSARSVDLYQDIRSFQAPEKYMARAHERGFRFAPLQPEDYDACLVGQRKNFSDKSGWVEAYIQLHPERYPSQVMTAFDSEGRQVGWTLMLSPVPELNHIWAFPQLCGPQTGLIGCVGVDADHRKSGIGLALICHAVENMKQRGIEGVFVDWVALDGWYEQVGFEVWRSYRPGEI